MSHVAPEVTVLLVRDGAWTVAVDPLVVRRVRSPNDATTAPSCVRLADLLGDPQRVEAALSAGARVLILDDHESSAGVLVQQSIGSREVSLDAIQPIPKVLTTHGVPTWMLAVVRLGDENVMIVDLPRALAAHSRGA